MQVPCRNCNISLYFRQLKKFFDEKIVVNCEIFLNFSSNKDVKEIFRFTQSRSDVLKRTSKKKEKFETFSFTKVFDHGRLRFAEDIT